MDVSDDEGEDSGEEEIVPRMGTIASLEQILRTLVVTIQDELPRLCEIMVELGNKLQGGRNQAELWDPPSQIKIHSLAQNHYEIFN